MGCLAVGDRGRLARRASRNRRAHTVLRGIATALAWHVTAGLASTTTWSLLPQPTDIRPGPPGSITIADGARVAVRGFDREALKPIVDAFVRRVADARGLHLQLASATHTHSAITFELEPPAMVEGETGYRIAVDRRGIRVVARSLAGAFYGGVTLWQLLTGNGWSRGTPAEIALGVIDDRPRFAWRGLLLDSGRHFQSAADIKRLIDWMSLEKLNVLLWHLTEDQGWRLEIPKYPELTRTGACRKAVGLDVELTGAADRPYCGFYSEADVRDIVSFAAARFVTIVPEIDLPGHSQAAVAAYPWLGVTGERPPVWTDWGISPWLLKPGDRTLQFVDDVLDEVMRLFPSRYVSIGGDEAEKQQWNASAELRARIQDLGLANTDQLQGWFVAQVADHLVKHGRVPVGWDDPVAAGVPLPPSQVVMSWHGSDGERIAREAARQGHDVVLTPQESLYFDYYQSDLPDEWPGQPPMTTLRQAYETSVIPEGATASETARIIGVQGSLWTEFMPTFARDQHALYPRVAALAELGWSAPRSRDWNGFLERLTPELARYRALGIGYADSAFAPAFDVSPGTATTLRVALSNQTSSGEIHYTTDGSEPTPASAHYVGPLEVPAQGRTTLRAATFAPGGFELGAPRSKLVDAFALLNRDSSELRSCSDRPAIRLDGRQPKRGPRPDYTVFVGDMCWQWSATPNPARHVTLTVERLAWRFGDDAKDAVVRPKATPAGEFELHADSCSGPLLAKVSLEPAGDVDGQSELTANLAGSTPDAPGHLCIFATGDPRDGQWALARVAFSD